MRSRTEMVTTTFVDSAEEDDDYEQDSEEDWRPVTNNKNKKKSVKRIKGGRNKRKANSSSCDYDKIDMKKQKYNATNTMGKEQNKFSTITDKSQLVKKIAKENNLPDKNGIFTLYLFKKDLDKDFKQNPHLCLWRRDSSSLLQKFIRIKTSNMEELLFTSTSVYSNWDEKRRKEFAPITVKSLEDNNRRVTIVDLVQFEELSKDAIRLNELKADQNQNENLKPAENIEVDIDNENVSEDDEENYYDDEDEDMDDENDSTSENDDENYEIQEEIREKSSNEMNESSENIESMN